MASLLYREKKKYRLTVVTLSSVVFIAIAALIVSLLMQRGRAGDGSRPNEASASTPAAQQSLSVQGSSGPAITSDVPTSQPPPQLPRQAAIQEANNPAIHPSTHNIDPEAVESALNTLVKRGEEKSSYSPAVSSDLPAGSDRYPGSQPIEVKDASLPDIGVPVATEVYTTSDSTSAVIGYYKRLYPDGEVSEVEGQKIIAVSRPGTTKVIAVGTTGSETRIAIVQPMN